MAKKERIFAAALWMVWLLSVSPHVAGQAPADASQAPLPDGVAIQIQAIPETATVGDPIRISLDVTAPADYGVAILRPETQAGDFAVLDFSSGPAEPEDTGSAHGTLPSTQQGGQLRHHRAQILTAVYKTGSFTFPPVRLKLSTAGGDIAVFSPPVRIEIKSVLDEKNPNLKDLKKQAEIPESTRWGRWFAIAAAGILLLAVLWLLRRRPGTRAAPLSPAQAQDRMDLAEAELKDLLARGFPGNGNAKRFYVHLSEIVRKILEIGFEIRTAERTTPEIVDSLYGRENLASEETALIESFLLRCDVVKFARYVPSGVEHEAASKDALRILEEAKKAVGSRQRAVANETSAGREQV
jgi:hypothetical protein